MDLPAPDGAETTNKIPVRVNCLLKVQDLFTDFLELGFAGDNVLRNTGIIRFRAERVQLTKNFLGDELEGAPDRLVLAEMMSELGQVAFEPREFFGDV